MNATKEQKEQVAVSALPELAVPTAERAIMLVNAEYLAGAHSIIEKKYECD